MLRNFLGAKPEKLREILNAQLPETIRVVDATEVPTTFHPRMSAIGKEYAYLVWNELEIPEVIRFRLRADRFLKHIVRNMVRVLTKVGDGRHQPDMIREILEAKNRSAAPGTAPADGLYLVEVFYE